MDRVCRKSFENNPGLAGRPPEMPYHGQLPSPLLTSEEGENPNWMVRGSQEVPEARVSPRDSIDRTDLPDAEFHSNQNDTRLQIERVMPNPLPCRQGFKKLSDSALSITVASSQKWLFTLKYKFIKMTLGVPVKLGWDMGALSSSIYLSRCSAQGRQHVWHRDPSVREKMDSGHTGEPPPGGPSLPGNL